MPHISSAKTFLTSSQVSSWETGVISSTSARVRAKNYWFMNVSTSGARVRLQGVGVDDSLNVYSAGGINATWKYLAVKFDYLGTESYKKIFSNTDGYAANGCYVKPSNGNLFISGGATNGNIVTSLDSTGATRFVKYTHQGDGNAVFVGQGNYKAPSTDSLYVFPTLSYGGSFNPLMTSVNQSDGSRSEQIRFDTGAQGNIYVYGAAKSTQGYIYIVGGLNSDGQSAIMINGSASAVEQIGEGNFTPRNYKAIAPDTLSTGMYCIRRAQASNGMIIDKITGAIPPAMATASGFSGGVWSFGVWLHGSSFTAVDVVVDSEGSVYMVGTKTVTNSISIVKFTTGGQLVWQRDLSMTGLSLFATGITVDANLDMYISGYYTGNTYDEGFIIKLPGDGTLTGTRTVQSNTVTNSLVYAASSYYVTNHGGATAFTTRSWTNNNYTYTYGDSGLSFSNASNTSNRTII